MSGPTRSDRDQIVYKTYDDRTVTSEVIRRTLRELEARQRRRQRLEQFRAVGLVVLLALILVAVAFVLVWQHILAG